VIVNIQLLRGIAALAVAFYHTGYVIPGTLYTDFLAVPIFFVISGFIMTHITRDTAENFLQNRLLRIVPLYWLASVFYAAIVVIVYPLLSKNSNNTVTALSFLCDLLFIPRLDDTGAVIYPVLSVGWTLNLEVWFYLLFAIALTISRRFAPLAVGAIVLIVWFFGPLLPAPFSFYANRYVVFFALGILTYYVAALPVLQAMVGVVIGIAGVGSLVYFVVEGLPVMSFVAPPLIVTGAVFLERGGFACHYRLATILGSFSYALYLCHAFVIGAFREAAKRAADLNMTTHTSAALMAVASSAAVAWFLYRWIERPLSTSIRSLISHSKRSYPRSTQKADFLA
jgi:exopolysaccharide production protein ExoZ